MPNKQFDIERNQLLTALHQTDIARLEPSLEMVTMRLGRQLSRSGVRIADAYFPCSGMISLVQPFADGSIAEVGLIGREGFWGAPLILAARSAPFEATVQGEGQALRISAEALTAAVDASPGLRRVFNRYAQFHQVQIALTAACNVLHRILQRAACRLLKAHDRLGGPEMPLSHERLSYMLGVRRAGVTETLGQLRDEGIIRTARGRITILDRKALEGSACECYKIEIAEHAQLFKNLTARAPIDGQQRHRRH